MRWLSATSDGILFCRWSHIYCPAAQRLAGGMTGRESDPKTSSGNGDDRTSIAKMVNGTSEVVTTTSPTSKGEFNVKPNMLKRCSQGL